LAYLDHAQVEVILGTGTGGRHLTRDRRPARDPVGSLRHGRVSRRHRQLDRARWRCRFIGIALVTVVAIQTVILLVLRTRSPAEAGGLAAPADAPIRPTLS